MYIIFSLVIPRWFDALLDGQELTQFREETDRRFDQLEEQHRTEADERAALHQQIASQFESLSDQLAAYNEAAEAASAGRLEYGVVRQVIVREEPFSGAARITVLQPGSQIEEINRQGKWLYVEYFDYIEGGLKFGWIYKRHLVLIEREE